MPLMDETPTLATSNPPGHRARGLLSLASLGLALVLLAATYLLISPPSDQGYPGARPWSQAPLLKRVTDLMSLGGAVKTARGVEIKDFAFYLATAAALVLLGARALVSGLLPPERRTAKGTWFYAQVFLGLWVLLSLASSQWSGDAALSLGQGALYGLALAWAVALAWTLESRDVPRLLWGYVVVAAAGAALCIWYYYGRNPYHRPGFPIGNPNTLAACTLPAILITGATLLGATRAWLRDGRLLAPWSCLGSIAALVPLVWCFVLTGSRGAQVGLAAGAAGVALLGLRRRVRWLLVALLLIAGAAGTWYLSSFHQDFALARGATIRFRFYAWRYAMILWTDRPLAGAGAGQYPRRANLFAALTGDRVLDPAAFMGELVEHAHNELFEVFAEIGLVGGVTYVAGLLATLAAGSALLRTGASLQRQWLRLGLLASVIALLVDSLFGVGLRLSGVPAVHYTLLGALWALCRSVSKLPVAEHPVTEPWLKRMLVRRYGLAAVALGLALVAGRLALRNWAGVRHEQAAEVALADGNHAAALEHAHAAEGALLDPVRQIIAAKRVVDCAFAWAAAEFGAAWAAAGAPQSAPQDQAADAQERLARAAALCRQASEAAVKLSQRVPNFGRMEAVGAQCAEMLAQLYGRSGDEQQATDWKRRALGAWHSQRALRPFDVQTLLALCRYPSLTGEYIGYLRDVLRCGFPPAEWHEALRVGSQARDFEGTLGALLRAVGPYDPQTDLNTLILSRKPEMYRLSAAWKAQNGQHEQAAADAAQAARFYRPMLPRFPELYSVALAEQADYTFRAWPDQPQRAADLLHEALRMLPVIQPQKYDQMAAPYRLQLARVLLEMGQHQEAERCLRAVLRARPADRTAWGWIIGLRVERGDAAAARAALREAEAAGVARPDLESIRAVLRERLPAALEE